MQAARNENEALIVPSMNVKDPGHILTSQQVQVDWATTSHL
jgi:hypothetical protein